MFGCGSSSPRTRSYGLWPPFNSRPLHEHDTTHVRGRCRREVTARGGPDIEHEFRFPMLLAPECETDVRRKRPFPIRAVRVDHAYGVETVRTV